MFESYIRGVFYYNYLSCHQLHTVALSFLPYTAGKQQLDEEMPKIRHFHFFNRYQRDDQSAIADFGNPQPFGCGFFVA